MVFSQVVRHLPQAFLQTIEEVERNATVSVACIQKNSLLIRKSVSPHFRRYVDHLVAHSMNVDGRGAISGCK